MQRNWINTEVDERGIATVTLCRPEKANALVPEMMRELLDRYRALGADGDVKAIVLRGEGRHFCAGADIAFMSVHGAMETQANIDDARLLAAMFQEIAACPKPTVALMQGAAVGGGVGLAACCDYVLADEERARFRITELSIGIRPSTISPFVVDRIGADNAKTFFCEQNDLRAREARRIHLVDEACPWEEHGERLDAVLARALEVGKAGLRAEWTFETPREPPQPKPLTESAPDLDERRNYNATLALVDTVADMRRRGEDALAVAGYTVLDLAEARATPYAQGKMREFLERGRR